MSKTTTDANIVAEDDDSYHFIDDFKVTSGKLVIGDPLLVGNKIIDKVANGEWAAEVLKTANGEYNATMILYLCEENSTRETQDEPEFIEDLLVDTGTMGVFCDSAYDDSDWLGDFDILADMLDNDDRAGGAPGGVACRSGYGDGNYCATVLRDTEGFAVSICVYFIDEDAEVEESVVTGEGMPAVNVKVEGRKELN